MYVFMGLNASDKIAQMELNKIISNIMKNGWSKKEYFQGFDCETITFKICKIFEHMEVYKTIYEGLVKPLY